jgi:hypothetical protein
MPTLRLLFCRRALPEMSIQRGDLDKRGEKCETRIAPTGEARILLNKLIQQLPPDKRAECERIMKEHQRQLHTRQ